MYLVMIEREQMKPRCTKDFLNAGGQNVLNTVTTLADQVRDINNIMGNVSKRPIRDSFVGKGVKKLGSLLENTNIVAENAMRVATFKTLERKVYSDARAAKQPET